MKHRYRQSLAWLLASSLLVSGCAPLVMGGAMLSGGLVATDRRTSGTQLEDQGIELRALGCLREALGERGHVNVASYNRQVLLTGELPTAADRQLAEQVVAKVENVRAIVNELGVMGNSALPARSSDAITTGRVKAAMLDSKEIYANAFKVVTERGVVYLMGRVTAQEATQATELARSVSGVQKVVRLLELISEEELKRLQAVPQSAPTGKPTQASAS